MQDGQHRGPAGKGENPEMPSERAMREVQEASGNPRQEPEVGPKTSTIHSADLDAAMEAADHRLQTSIDAAMKPIRECYELLSADFLRLVAAIARMNKYQQRIPEVTEVCDAILKPDPALAKANEALAEARACKRNIGQVTAVTADWDANWQYLFTWRGEHGFSTMAGFDLREGKPGLDALKEALAAHGIPLAACHLEPPSDEDGKGMARRIIWQAAVK